MDRRQQPAQAAKGVGLHWYAVYTRSRAEKAVNGFLKRLGHTTYLPLKSEWSRRKDRRQKIVVPALPGYVFIQCELTAERVTQIKKVPNVIHIVGNPGSPSVIPDSEVESLRLALESQLEVDLGPFFVVGQQVRVVRGKLTGAMGILTRISHDQHRLVISITTINQMIAVRIDAADVEPASG